MGCYIWYSEERSGRAAAPPSPILAVPNVTAHPSTASVPITVLLYDGPLLCGLNVAIKRLKHETPRLERFSVMMMLTLIITATMLIIKIFEALFLLALLSVYSCVLYMTR